MDQLSNEEISEQLLELSEMLEKGSHIDCGDGLYQIDAKKEIAIRKKMREVYKLLFGDDTIQ